MLVYLAMLNVDTDKSKFEIMYHTYKSLMLYHANRILGDSNDSEDVVHESFLKIAKVIDKIEEPLSLQTKNLLITIVERTAIDLYRQRKRRKTVVLDEEFINIPSADDIESIHGKADLAAAMACLPTRYREVLLLRYDNGFSEKEVAQLLSMTPANVHKTIQRAKKKLATILKNEGEFFYENHG